VNAIKHTKKKHQAPSSTPLSQPENLDILTGDHLGECAALCADGIAGAGEFASGGLEAMLEDEGGELLVRQTATRRRR
jgi:hypothetical protein